MFLTTAILILVFSMLIIGSYTDIKTREVPDWLNFSMIAAGLGIRFIYSVVMWDFSHALEGAYGFLIGLGLAYFMFYTGQWGGGDSKMLMAIGALLGFSPRFDASFVSFLINMLFAGAIYGFIWSTSIAIIRWKRFAAKIKENYQDHKFRIARNITYVLVLICIIAIIISGSYEIKFLLTILALLIFLLLYTWLFVKAVEESCMLKHVNPEKLTEGDWIAEPIIIGKKEIAGPKDLGISKEQIRELLKLKKEKKISKVLIKEGIPFVPSFLLAMLMTVSIGNIVLLFI